MASCYRKKPILIMPIGVNVRKTIVGKQPFQTGSLAKATPTCGWRLEIAGENDITTVAHTSHGNGTLPKAGTNCHISICRLVCRKYGGLVRTVMSGRLRSVASKPEPGVLVA